jgi:hypothetical protein
MSICATWFWICAVYCKFAIASLYNMVRRLCSLLLGCYGISVRCGSDIVQFIARLLWHLYGSDVVQFIARLLWHLYGSDVVQSIARLLWHLYGSDVVQSIVRLPWSVFVQDGSEIVQSIFYYRVSISATWFRGCSDCCLVAIESLLVPCCLQVVQSIVRLLWDVFMQYGSEVVKSICCYGMSGCVVCFQGAVRCLVIVSFFYLWLVL